MSYIDAIHDNNGDRIYVVERTPDGKRTYKEFPTNYTFYYSDPKGKHRSIYNDPVSRFSTRKRSEFEKERRIHSGKKLFESDINRIDFYRIRKFYTVIQRRCISREVFG